MDCGFGTCLAYGEHAANLLLLSIAVTITASGRSGQPSMDVYPAVLTARGALVPEPSANTKAHGCPSPDRKSTGGCCGPQKGALLGAEDPGGAQHGQAARTLHPRDSGGAAGQGWGH